MLNHFVCGSGTLHQQEEDGNLPCSSPKKSKRKESKNNNPYSDRGLDKFSALLADLDERRQKVYSKMSPQDVSLVRFAYSSNDDFVPIVVKVKHKTQDLKTKHLTTFSEQSSEEPTKVEQRNEQHNKSLESHNNKTMNFSFSWDMLKRPSFYVPAVVILILVFLVVFGRSVATLCTCVVWYVVPTWSEYVSSKPKKSMMNSKKRDYVRGWLNEAKMMNHPEELASPTSSAKQGHHIPCFI